MLEKLHIDQLRATLGPVSTELFLRRAQALPEAEVPALLARIDEHVALALRAREQDVRLDYPLGRRIASACRALLALYGELDPPRRCLVVGAVRYFIERRDADDDFGSSMGFEDDARVVDFVVAQTGGRVKPVREQPAD